MQHKIDGDGTCLILFAGNMILSAAGSLTNAVHSMGWVAFLMIVLQGLALLASIIASVYVAIDHHLKIKWKKTGDKVSPKERELREKGEKQKHNDNGGRY